MCTCEVRGLKMVPRFHFGNLPSTYRSLLTERHQAYKNHLSLLERHFVGVKSIKMMDDNLKINTTKQNDLFFKRKNKCPPNFFIPKSEDFLLFTVLLRQRSNLTLQDTCNTSNAISSVYRCIAPKETVFT